MNKRQFLFSCSGPGFPWDAEIEGAKVRVIELRVGLDVDHTTTPVEFSSGKYNNSPFVSGVRSAKSSELQFVLARKPDGTTEGRIVDAFGVRSLTGVREHADEALSPVVGQPVPENLSVLYDAVDDVKDGAKGQETVLIDTRTQKGTEGRRKRKQKRQKG
jgi:hypothetical protein